MIDAETARILRADYMLRLIESELIRICTNIEARARDGYDYVICTIYFKDTIYKLKKLGYRISRRSSGDYKVGWKKSWLN